MKLWPKYLVTKSAKGVRRASSFFRELTAHQCRACALVFFAAVVEDVLITAYYRAIGKGMTLTAMGLCFTIGLVGIWAYDAVIKAKKDRKLYLVIAAIGSAVGCGIVLECFWWM